jgi:hypothetical protein
MYNAIFLKKNHNVKIILKFSSGSGKSIEKEKGSLGPWG